MTLVWAIILGTLYFLGGIFTAVMTERGTRRRELRQLLREELRELRPLPAFPAPIETSQWLRKIDLAKWHRGYKHTNEPVFEGLRLPMSVLEQTDSPRRLHDGRSEETDPG